MDWLLEKDMGALEHLAIDGKVLRGSARVDGKPLQLLSDETHRLRLPLAQVEIEEKSNEIPALPVLTGKLPKADDSLVTADAMHC